MGKVIRTLLGLASVAMATGLLFAADVAFSLEGLYKLLGAAAVLLVVFSALSLLPLVQPRARPGKWVEAQHLAFVVLFSVTLVFAMNLIRQRRESRGIGPLLHSSGNCTTLFSPLMRSRPVQIWMSQKKPGLRYSEAVLQDACKVAELHQEFSQPRPPICSADEARDPDRCYRDVLDELMARDPLTMPGIGLALTEGMAIAMRDRGPRGDSAPSFEERVVGEYRLASSTLGLVETVLNASRRHLSPGDLLGEPAQVEEASTPEWEIMKILYRRNWISDEDEARLLDQMDRKLDETTVRELLETARRINSKLEKPKRSAVAVLVAPYQDQINHYDLLIHGYEEDNI